MREEKTNKMYFPNQVLLKEHRSVSISNVTNTVYLIIIVYSTTITFNLVLPSTCQNEEKFNLQKFWMILNHHFSDLRLSPFSTPHFCTSTAPHVHPACAPISHPSNDPLSTFHT